MASGAVAAAQTPHGRHAPAHTVSIGFGDFAPAHLDVLAGDSVTWRNDSVRQHTVTANDESWDSGRLGARAVFRRRFDEPGPVGYYCRLHVITASLEVHSVLLDDSHSPGNPGLPRDLSGRAAAEPGTEVRIEADSGAGVELAGSATVELDGAFHEEIAPRTTTTYRAVLGSEASPPVTVVVLDRKVSVSARARGRRTVVKVKVTPPSPHERVALQLRLPDRFGWWPVSRARLSHHSEARFSIPRGTRRKARVVMTLDDGATVTAYSPSFRIGRR
jgi:plastocyanin